MLAKTKQFYLLITLVLIGIFGCNASPDTPKHHELCSRYCNRLNATYTISEKLNDYECICIRCGNPGEMTKRPIYIILDKTELLSEVEKNN